MDNLITGERIADLLSIKGIDFEQKKMFGGLCFLVDDKMLAGTYKGGIMARVSPDEADRLAEQPGVSHMIHAGRAMPGYLMIESEVYDSDEALGFWLDKCLEFNPKAKSSKKKK